MTARAVVEHALTVYYADSRDPQGIVAKLLDQYDADRGAGSIVWILSKGEDYEGGTVLGVYASKEAAKGPFVEAARSIPFDLDKAWQDEESGAVHAHGGCDWVSLVPHPLVSREQLT